MLTSLCANKLGLFIRGSEILQNDSDSRLESLIVTRVDSNHSVKNVTRVETSHHLSQRDSSRVRVTKNRVESLTRVTLSLPFCKQSTCT